MKLKTEIGGLLALERVARQLLKDIQYEGTDKSESGEEYEDIRRLREILEALDRGRRGA
jgi:hypothetical protein